MSFALVTLSTPEIVVVGRLSDANRRNYCRGQGYSFISGDRSLDPTRPAAWSKLLLLLEHLDRHEWLFWSDADSLVLRPQLPLSFFTDDPANAGADLLVTRDRHGCNSGQFLISNRSGRARPFLEAVFAQSRLDSHRLGDQAAFTYAIDAGLTPIIVRYVPKVLLNAEVYDVTRESFVIHFLGQPARVCLMRSWLRELGQLPPEPDAWAVAAGPASAAAQAAGAALRAGRVDEAKRICREALAASCVDAAAMHVLGLACRRAGDNDEGFDWLCRSVALADSVADYQNNLAAALAECGALHDARAHFQAALRLRPGFAAAAENLARLAAGQKTWPRLPIDPAELYRRTT